MRRLFILPTLLVLLGAVLIAAAASGHSEDRKPGIDAGALVSSRRAFGMVRPGIDHFPGETTTTTAPPSTEPPSQEPEPAAGGLLCPVQGAVSFVDSFGAPRSGGRAHQGVDMMAAMGTPTVAPVSGRVEHRGNDVGGMSWWLYGDNGDEYFGTHLSGYENEGVGWVAAGTVIGYVGDSGNAAGTPHLHFEIHPGGGGAVNPFPDVAAAC